MNNEVFSRLMYALTKQAANYSFRDFLETWEITEEEYDQIKRYLKATYEVKTYV